MIAKLTTAEFLRVNAGRRDDECVTVRFACNIGLLGRGAFADLIAYGRSLGVDIEAFRGGGWLEQRYRVVVSGEWGKVRRFFDAWDRLAD